MAQTRLTLNRFAAELNRNRKYVQKVLEEIEPIEKSPFPKWTFEQWDRAVATYERGGLKLTDVKTQEEIRKLKLANDEKEDLVVRREFISGVIATVMTKSVKYLETKLITQLPSDCDGLSVPETRKYCRKVFDGFCKSAMRLGKKLEIK